MKSPTLFLLVLVACLLGCDSSGSHRQSAAQSDAPSQSEGLTTAKVQAPSAKLRPPTDQMMQPVSLNDGVKSELASLALERKIIRNAELNLEVVSPVEAQRRVASLAESHGGFVVTSEAKQRDQGASTNRILDIKLVVRVPSNQFDQTVSAIEALATSVIQRNVTGQDVTEEFIDLEARIKTQKALELQFLEIMKQASKVVDALEVQRQIADVRTEIERLEGRKRFLENRSSLSTITVSLVSPRPIAVAATGFSRKMRDAVSDSVDVASAIVLFAIRFVIVMIPVFVFLILPAGVLGRYFVRRTRKVRLPETLDATPTSS
jgi:Domain of unknown function (DUF4349)